MPPTVRPVSEAAALKPTDATTSGGEVDTGAYDGLRGVLAVWVMLGHFCRASFWRSNLGNKFAMPLFFMLSGCANPGMRSHRWDTYSTTYSTTYPTAYPTYVSLSLHRVWTLNLRLPAGSCWCMHTGGSAGHV
jgi:hypothetical protein